MTLGQLISLLEKENPEKVVRLGFDEPHSYRGDYMDLEFTPAQNVPVKDMLAAAKSCVGRTFYGYKGGDFQMSEGSFVWLGHWGQWPGETLGPTLLRFMLADVAEAQQ